MRYILFNGSGFGVRWVAQLKALVYAEQAEKKKKNRSANWAVLLVIYSSIVSSARGHWVRQLTML